MLSAHIVGILSALAGAASWGGGDFSGGLAARRHNQFQVLALSTLASVALLGVAFALSGEAFPDAASTWWAMAAGVSGVLGLAALFAGLARGRAAVVSPTAGVVGAVIPVGFNLVRTELPSEGQLAGFALALAGIWLVTQTPAAGEQGARTGLGLGVLAGLGFGGFLAAIAQVGEASVFGSLLVAKAASLALALVVLRARGNPLIGPKDNPLALLAGVLDVGGNIGYLLATQFTRLDVAAIVASMYPAGTVFLAKIVQDERVGRAQWAGVACCLAAIALLTV